MTGKGNKSLAKPKNKTRRALVDASALIQLDRATEKDAAFLARQLIQATLPHSDPKADTWTRRNGNFALAVQAGLNPFTGKTYGIPYGIIPRLLLFWITTEAIKTNNPRLELGSSLAQFMRDVGLNPSTGGGIRGDAPLLLAREKFGQSLEVRGSKEFKEKVLRTAIEKEMDVRFADPEMEQLRAVGLRKQIERRRPAREIS
jgi:hypothetical protein